MVGSIAALVAAKGAAIGGLFLLLVWLVGLAVWILFIWLCVKKSKEKGYETWIGLLLGIFLSWIGLLIVMFALPDKGAPKPMAPMGMPGSMPMATPPAAPMATPPAAPMAPPPAAPMATPPAAAPTPPPPAPPAPPTPPTPGV